MTKGKRQNVSEQGGGAYCCSVNIDWAEAGGPVDSQPPSLSLMHLSSTAHPTPLFVLLLIWCISTPFYWVWWVYLQSYNFSSLPNSVCLSDAYISPLFAFYIHLHAALFIHQPSESVLSWSKIMFKTLDSARISVVILKTKLRPKLSSHVLVLVLLIQNFIKRCLNLSICDTNNCLHDWKTRWDIVSTF